MSQIYDVKLTQDIVRDALHYDPTTGVFIWKKRHDMPNNWNARFPTKRAGKNSGKGYRQIKIFGKWYAEHQIAFLYVHGWIPEEIDHINCIPSDNRIINLRDARNQNSQNRKLQKNNTSGYKGVCWHKPSKKWVAMIRVNYTRIHLGSFETSEEAYEAYCEASTKYHGEFSKIK